MSHYCPFSAVKGLWGEGFWLWLLLHKQYHLHAISISRFQKRGLLKWGEGSGSAWRLGAIPYTPWPSKNCWRTASLLWFEDKTSGLTTAWTFVTTNSLLQPDCWQERQVPHLRFPFKDFSKPSFNSANCSIMQGRQAFDCHLPVNTPLPDKCPFLSLPCGLGGHLKGRTEVHQNSPDGP